MNRLRMVLAGVAMAGTALTANAQTIQVNKENKTIAVTATDQATADPEVAVIDIGFQTFAPDAPTAYAQGSKISNAILAKLSEAGIPEKAIQSKAQNLQRTEFDADSKLTPQERQQRQFSLTQSWSLRTSAKSAATALNIAIQAGANHSGDINWDVLDRNALEAKAAEKALLRARTIAEQMAQGLRAKMIGLVYASNQAPNRNFGGGGGGDSAEVIVSADIASLPKRIDPLAIRPQQVEESATVYAVFAIE
jgi:uncharacterized protein